MATVAILHGTQSSPQQNWFGWAAEQFRQAGHTALTPHLPTPQGQDFATWAGILDAYRGQGLLEDTSVLVGHSSSASFLPRYIADRQMRLRAVVLVSGFHQATLGFPEIDAVNAHVSTCDEADYEALKNLVPQRVCFHSTNDPYVPTAELEKFSRLVDGATFRVGDAGHFNTAAGYEQFPDLVTLVSEMLTLDPHDHTELKKSLSTSS